MICELNFQIFTSTTRTYTSFEIKWDTRAHVAVFMTYDELQTLYCANINLYIRDPVCQLAHSDCGLITLSEVTISSLINDIC